MRAVDTNILVRLVVRDDVQQAATAETFIENGAWVSMLALAEATWVLGTVYQQSAAQLVTAIGMLLDHKSLTIQDDDVVTEALALFRAKSSLGFSDCLMLEIARKAGHLPLGTFDRAFAKSDGTCKL